MPSKDFAEDDRLAYWRAVDWLTASVHELPAGVLDGNTGADETACTEMLGELKHFRELCEHLGLDDHIPFIEACSWHLTTTGTTSNPGAALQATRSTSSSGAGRPAWVHRPRRRFRCTGRTCLAREPSRHPVTMDGVDGAAGWFTHADPAAACLVLVTDHHKRGTCDQSQM